jgi:hypothetical protein
MDEKAGFAGENGIEGICVISCLVAVTPRLSQKENLSARAL